MWLLLYVRGTKTDGHLDDQWKRTELIFVSSPVFHNGFRNILLPKQMLHAQGNILGNNVFAANCVSSSVNRGSASSK